MGDLVVNGGDINDDGFDDFLTMVDGSTYRGVWVLFGPGKPTSPDLANLAPTDGYRIQTASDAQWPASIGDQNGDGVPDMVVGESPAGSNATVIYGVKDPTADLAPCNPPAVTRCISTSNPVSSSGSRLGFKVSSPVSLVATGVPWDSGDFDGDGKEELLAAAPDDAQLMVLDNNLGDDCPASPGLCTIDLSTLSAPDVIKIAGLPAGVPLAQGGTVSPGDVNDDGRDDIVVTSGTDGSVQPGAWVLYGQEWTQGNIDLSTLTSVEGFKVSLPYSVFGSSPFVPGDVNGDGIADLGIQSLELVPSQATYFTVIYGQAGTPERSPSSDPPAPGEGVQYDWDSAFSPLPFSGINGIVQTSLGDLNGDGGDEFSASASNATIDGKSNAGRVFIFQSGVPDSQNVVTVGASSLASEVLVLAGDTTNLRLGTGLASGGDIDGDGVGDIALGASGQAITTPVTANNAGTVGILSASRFYPQGSTGIANVSGVDSASISGVANANRRASVAHFQYGTTDSYGSETTDQAIGSAGQGRGVEADLAGLDADTEYHYRLVVENDLGVKAYGPDRTFKTAAVPVERCAQDNTLPGCSGYTGDKFCQEYPSDPKCQEKPTVPGLSQLVVNPNAGKVRRGGKTVIWAWITSTGTKDASGVAVCANAPKRQVRVVGKRCQNLGNLAPGKTARVKFQIQVKGNAKRKARPKINFVATAGDGLGNRTATARLTVR